MQRVKENRELSHEIFKKKYFPAVISLHTPARIKTCFSEIKTCYESVSISEFFQVSSANSTDFRFKSKNITITGIQHAAEILLRIKSLKIFSFI